MENHSLALALFDFLPPLAFLAGAIFLVKMAFMCCGIPCGCMMIAGSFLVFLGGFMKAAWKLLYVTGMANISWMSEGQFILLSIGFLAICISVILMARKLRADPNAAVLLGIVPWKLPFLFLMILTSLGAEGILAYIAFRRNLRPAAAGFIVGVMGILAMGVFSSAEQSLAMQWIEEISNTVSQSGFMLGCILLHLDFKIRGCEVQPSKTAA